MWERPTAPFHRTNWVGGPTPLKEHSAVTQFAAGPRRQQLRRGGGLAAIGGTATRRPLLACWWPAVRAAAEDHLLDMRRAHGARRPAVAVSTLRADRWVFPAAVMRCPTSECSAVSAIASRHWAAGLQGAVLCRGKTRGRGGLFSRRVEFGSLTAEHPKDGTPPRSRTSLYATDSGRPYCVSFG